MSLIKDILKKIGISDSKSKLFEYIADSLYWIILFYLIMTYGYYTNEFCVQAVYEINNNCQVFCSENNILNLQYANSSGININWDNSTSNWGFLGNG